MCRLEGRHERPSDRNSSSSIDNGSVRIGIIGLGYVGLPLALAFAETGHAVLGFDVDPDKIAHIQRGEGYIRHLDGGRVAAARSRAGWTPPATSCACARSTRS